MASFNVMLHPEISFVVIDLYFLTLQAAQVYQSRTIERLSQMISFFGFSVVEKISVDAVKHEFLTMKVDHMNGAVSFSVLVRFHFSAINSIKLAA